MKPLCFYKLMATILGWVHIKELAPVLSPFMLEHSSCYNNIYLVLSSVTRYKLLRSTCSAEHVMSLVSLVSYSPKCLKTKITFLTFRLWREIKEHQN